MIISDEMSLSMICDSAGTAHCVPDNFALCTEFYHPSVCLFGQQLISQEILLLPLISYIARKLSDIEACLGKSPYNWFPEKGCASDTILHLLSFPASLSTRLSVILPLSPSV